MSTKLQTTSDKLPFELFAEFAELKTTAKRVAFLHANQSYTILTILQAAFDSKIVFELPEGTPPFTRDDAPAGMSLARIRNVISTFGKLVKGHPALSAPQKERAFIKMLESVNGPDADILVAAKDKKLSELIPELTRDIVKKAFPTLFTF